MTKEPTVSTMSMIAYHQNAPESWLPSPNPLTGPRNNRTEVFNDFSPSQLTRPLSAFPRRDFFIEHYKMIRSVLTSPYVSIPNYTIVAAGFNGRHFRHSVLPLHIDKPSDLVVGRHQKTHLCLLQDEAISLRHLLLRVSYQDGKPLLRVIDLYTQLGFNVLDEGVHPTTYALCPTHFSWYVGNYQMMAILNKRMDWPEDPEEAWELIEQDREQARQEKLALRPEISDALQDLMSKKPPVSNPNPLPTGVHKDAQPKDDKLWTSYTTPELQALSTNASVEVPLGYLEMDRERIPLTKSELQVGVLLGRYERCQVRNTLLKSNRVSRVHLMLWWDVIDEKLWAIDVASTNGSTLTTLDSRKFLQPSVLLDGKAVLKLARETVYWHPM